MKRSSPSAAPLSSDTDYELAEEFEPTAQSIRGRVNQADADEGRGDGVTSAERARLPFTVWRILKDAGTHPAPERSAT